MAGWRIVVGADDAGRAYEDLILADLRADPRVASVEDLGVHDGEHRHRHGGEREQGRRGAGHHSARQLQRRTFGVVQRLPSFRPRSTRHRARTRPTPRPRWSIIRAGPAGRV
jgi:hypothetical protein